MDRANHNFQISIELKPTWPDPYQEKGKKNPTTLTIKIHLCTINWCKLNKKAWKNKVKLGYWAQGDNKIRNEKSWS